MYLDHEGNCTADISPSWGQPNTRVHTAPLRDCAGSPNNRAPAERNLSFVLSWVSKIQPKHQMSHLGPKNLSRTGVLPSLWQTQPDPQQEGKTDHNVGGLACILGLPNTCLSKNPPSRGNFLISMFPHQEPAGSWKIRTPPRGRGFLSINVTAN